MNRCRIILFSLVVVALVIAGCSSQPGTAPVTPQPAGQPLPATPVPTPLPYGAIQQFSGTWIVTVMGTQGGTYAFSPAADISLEIDNGHMEGYDGCNNYQSPYALTGTSSRFGSGIDIGPVSNSGIFCRGLADQDSTYLALLAATNAFAGDDTHLTFTTGTGDSIVFHRPGIVPESTTLPQYGY